MSAIWSLISSRVIKRAGEVSPMDNDYNHEYNISNEDHSKIKKNSILRLLNHIIMILTRHQKFQTIYKHDYCQ